MVAPCDYELLQVAFSAAALTLYGLVIDGIGAFVIGGFSLRPVNKIGREIWPPYHKISSAWDSLHENGKVSEEDNGFQELAATIGTKQHLIEDKDLNVEVDELVFSSIKYSDDAEPPYTSTDDIEITIEEADCVENNFSLNDTSHMERKVAIDLINQRIENGFLKVGSVLLIIGFSLQIFAQLVRMFDTYIVTC
jgi:hypothetical protein